MEFLLLAVLGLATFGTKEMLSASEEEDSKGSKPNGKKPDGSKGNGKKENGHGDSEDADSEEPQKTPKQELIEAIAKYESAPRNGETSKIVYEITEH